jgi:hypothetical protein
MKQHLHSLSLSRSSSYDTNPCASASCRKVKPEEGFVPFFNQKVIKQPLMTKFLTLLLFAVFFVPNAGIGQTTLSTGDIVILAFKGTGSGVDGFSFMPLVNLTSGTVIHFTDYGWNSTTSEFHMGEEGNPSGGGSMITYTAPTAITAGTIITQDAANIGGSAFSGHSTFPRNFLNNNYIYSFVATLAGHDGLLVFQGTYTNPTFITGFHTGQWGSSGYTDYYWSDLPSGLTNGTNAFYLTDLSVSGNSGSDLTVDDAKYNGLVTEATPAQWRARVNNSTNWLKVTDNNPSVSFPTGTLTVTASATSPTITSTAAATVIATSASLGGNVTADGGASVTERGVVYSSTDQTPEIGESGVTKNDNGTGTGTFSETISGLVGSTTYYFRAYAINSAGTSYGSVLNFTTLAATYEFSKNGTGNWSDVANWVGGVVPGASSTVTISQGNAVVNGDYSCTNLTISNGTSVTIDPNNCLSVSGTLTNNAGVGGLVLASTVSGNGTLLNNTSGVNASVKQFLTKNKWHYIGIPVNYVADVADVLYHAYVLLIDESDASVNSSTGWNDLVSGDSLIKLHGYAVNYTYPGNSDTTITFTGVLNTGVIDTIFDSENEGWNFISNPYPCTMDWDAAGGKTITNGNDAFYVWQPTSEVYGSYISGGSTNGQTKYISSNQGFFFQVWATTASIEFTNSAKVSNSVLFSLNDLNPVNFKPVLDENEPPLELLKEKSLLLGVTDDGTHFDETLIRTNLFARTDYDSNLDASKLIAFESKTPQIFSISNGREYSINTIPKIGKNLIIPITILSKSCQSQILSIRSLQNMDENQSINLYDSEGVYLCDLSLSDYSYTGVAGMEKTFYVSLEPVKKSAIADFHQTVENSRKKFQRITIKQLNQAAFMVQSTAKSHSDNQSSSLIK